MVGRFLLSWYKTFCARTLPFLTCRINSPPWSVPTRYLGLCSKLSTFLRSWSVCWSFDMLEILFAIPTEWTVRVVQLNAIIFTNLYVVSSVCLRCVYTRLVLVKRKKIITKNIAIVTCTNQQHHQERGSISGPWYFYAMFWFWSRTETDGKTMLTNKQTN
jgi:hypothetical protein